MDADALLVDLDEDQRRAVTTSSHLVAVIAGAGSGKTRVLTRRIAYRIATRDADARHTLALTFTREAAGELRRRLRAVGIDERIESGTFHATALNILRQRWSDQRRTPPTIVEDRPRLVGLATGASGEALNDLVAELSWASARGLDASGYLRSSRGKRRSDRATRVAEAIDAYAAEKRSRGVLDLDDLLVVCAAELNSNSNFADAVRWRFRHLLVDEAQDLTPIQHALLRALQGARHDLFLVGDPAQSIYGFNGSDPTLLQDVSTHFPEVEILRLSNNHRCTPQVVTAGVHVLQHSQLGSGLLSTRPDGDPITITSYPDDESEAAAIANALNRLDLTAIRQGDVAVLARTHAHCERIERALQTADVDIRPRGFRGDSAGRRALDTARRLREPGQLRAWAHDVLDDTTNVVEPALDSPGTTPAASDIAQAALDFLREQPDGDGAAFAAWVAAEDPFGLRRGGVEVLTFHAAKGREWPFVWIAAAESGSLPHRSATTRDEIAEEARLLYVAITRATSQCHITWAERRNGYRRTISPFLDKFESSEPIRSTPPEALVTAMRSPERRDAKARHDAVAEWRAHTARRAGVIPETICSDRLVRQLAERRPSNVEELNELTGWGHLTCERLFPDLQQALQLVD